MLAWCREHEQMSLELLDLAVLEVRERDRLHPGHFLCNDANISAVKAMIKGTDDSVGIPRGKSWLYTIVNNSHTGTFAHQWPLQKQ